MKVKAVIEVTKEEIEKHRADSGQPISDEEINENLVDIVFAELRDWMGESVEVKVVD